MNNFFSLKRFCAYLTYDLRCAKNNYLLSLIILGITPLIFFLIYSIFGGSNLHDYNFIIQFVAMSTTTLVAILSFPTTHYGSITDKRAGASWSMIPASTFEKFLSMLLITCVIFPIALAAVFICTDGLMSIVLPHAYGPNIFANASRLLNEIPADVTDLFSFNAPAIAIADWCESILIFTLGAVVFKKSKVAKTILAVVIFSIVVSSISTALGFFGLFEHLQEFNQDLCNLSAQSIESFVRELNIIINVIYFVMFAGLLGGIYYRLKTIQH